MTGPTEGTCVEQPHAHVGQCYRRGLADGYAQGLGVTAETGPAAAAEAVLRGTWLTRKGRGRYLASAELEPDWFPAFAAALAAAGLLADPAATDTTTDECCCELIDLCAHSSDKCCKHDAAARAVRDTAEPEDQQP